MLARTFGPVLARRTWLDTAHLVIGLGFAITWSTVVITMAGLSVSMLITLLGIPLLVATIFLGRIIGIVERWRVGHFLDTDLPAFPPIRLEGSFWHKLRTLLADGPGWRGLAYGLVYLPWSIVTFTLAVTAWSVAVAGITLPLWAWSAATPAGEPFQVDDTYVVQGWGQFGVVAAGVVLGLLVLVATPRLLRRLAQGDAWLVRSLLSPDPTAALTQRVEELTVSRDASLDSAGTELRRIERDLHDGAQQRLVALAMDLGLARERLERDGGDPATVAAVARAHEEAKAAIVEMRDLVRGIHPTVLTDRGLDAALSGLIARSPVPVRLTVDIEERPSPAVEAAAYFVVAESLTNIAKHSGATRASVSITRSGDRLSIEVFDDGVGGAAFLPGGGLGGLRDRVAAAEGTWRFTSPEGGPTLLSVELPCGS